MTTVTSPSTSLPKAKIVVPSDETKSSTTLGKKDTSSKTKPDFVVRTNYPESNAPLGVSVPKLNRHHVVVRKEKAQIKFLYSFRTTTFFLQLSFVSSIFR